MEIVSHIYFEESINIEAFRKTFFGRCIIPPLHHKTIGEILNNRKITEALEVMCQTPWQGSKGLWGSQITSVILANDDVTRIMLLKSPQGDKLALALMGDATSAEVLSIAYIGNESLFKQYMKVLNIPEITLITNAIHYEEN